MLNIPLQKHVSRDMRNVMLINRYVPSLIPKDDLKMYNKAGLGLRKIGFGRKTAIIVVDMTRLFVEDQFPPGCAQTGQQAAKSIRKLLDKARAIGIPIIYTKGSSLGTAGITKVSEEEIAAVVHACAIEGANEITNEIAPKSKDIVIEKAKPSAFMGTPLLGLMNYFDVDTVIVTGMVTSGCVRATVVDAFSYNFKVIVPIECVADRGKVPHQINLFDMDMKYADVMPLSDVLKHLASISKT